jgi:hypothetical protein
MITLAEYPAEQIMPLIGAGMPALHLVAGVDRFRVKAGGVRLECFKRNPVCVRCKVIGKVFKLQRHEYRGPKLGMNCFVENCPWCSLDGYTAQRRKTHQYVVPHLNLFAVDRAGGMILMTKDHIYPKSKGGSDEIENMQTMCYRCNQYKADTVPVEFANDFQSSSHYELAAP